MSSLVFVTAALDAGVPLPDVEEPATHADPPITRRYDQAPTSPDRHATDTPPTSPGPPAQTHSKKHGVRLAETGRADRPAPNVITHNARSADRSAETGGWHSPRRAHIRMIGAAPTLSHAAIRLHTARHAACSS